MVPLLITLYSPGQEALLEQAAAAIDAGRPALAAGLARAAVEVAPEALMAPAGLALLSLAEQRQRDPAAALAATLERLERFGEGSEWAAQSAAHALAASRDAPDLERDLRGQAMAAHHAANLAAQRESIAARGGAPLIDLSGTSMIGCYLIDRSDISQAMIVGAPAFQRCATEARQTHPALAGTLKLRFDLTVDGTVHDPRVVEDGVGDPDLAACVVEVLTRLPFDAQPRGALVVTYPLVFPAEP